MPQEDYQQASKQTNQHSGSYKIKQTEGARNRSGIRELCRDPVPVIVIMASNRNQRKRRKDGEQEEQQLETRSPKSYERRTRTRTLISCSSYLEARPHGFSDSSPQRRNSFVFQEPIVSIAVANGVLASVGNRRPMNLRVLSDSVNVPVGPHHSTAVTVFYNYCETKAIVAQCDPIGGSS